MAMTKSLIAYDSLNDIKQYMHYDDENDTAHFESVGDATPVLEMNRVIANDGDNWKRGMKNDFVRYASIPAIFALKILSEKGIDIYKKEHGNALSKILEDPEYRHLKCTTKRHIIKAYD